MTTQGISNNYFPNFIEIDKQFDKDGLLTLLTPPFMGVILSPDPNTVIWKISALGCFVIIGTRATIAGAAAVQHKLNTTSWDDIYAALPDPRNFNIQFSRNRFSSLAAAALLGVFLTKDSQPLLNQACLWSAIGITAVKVALSLGSYVKERVWEKTTAFEAKFN